MRKKFGKESKLLSTKMSNLQSVTCPNCDTEFDLSASLSTKLEAQIKAKLDQEIAQQKQALQAQQAKIKAEQAQLEQQIQQQVAKKLEDEKKQLWAKAKGAVNKQMVELKSQLEEQQAKLKSAEQQELDLRKKARELEERQQKQDLEIARKLDAERQKIVEQTKDLLGQETQLKLKEKDELLAQMKKTIDDLKRKSEQGSMQIQGEVLEEDLKDLLSESFAEDEVSDVPTGVRGADLLQKVKVLGGVTVGSIVFESKNTKQWSDQWLSKLKQDQGKVKADIAILVSKALPEGVETFTRRRGVWICSYSQLINLVSTLRFHLLELHKLKSSLDGQEDKLSQLFGYISSSQFKNRVENMVLAFSQMRSDLETEKRSMQRIWSKREKELERMMLNTSGLYGDLQGVVGNTLPSIEHLELPG